jgi:hypothetical protein
MRAHSANTYDGSSDHLIIGEGREYSFAETGHLQPGPRSGDSPSGLVACFLRSERKATRHVRSNHAARFPDLIVHGTPLYGRKSVAVLIPGFWTFALMYDVQPLRSVLNSGFRCQRGRLEPRGVPRGRHNCASLHSTAALPCWP